MKSCRVCGNEDKNISFTAREMFIGFRDEFKYYQCSKCGCLQIKEIPSDMSKYYPENYYSFNSFNSFNIMSESNTPKSLVAKGKKYLQKKIIEHSFGRKNFAGSFLRTRYKLPAWAEWLKVANIGFDNFILDVGCGTGSLIMEMRQLGFSNLIGIDPYIDQTIRYENGVQVLKCTLDELEGKYDFIMLNHSFEHMDDPLSTLNDIHLHLSDNRFTLIRIPVAQSYAWETYGTNWYQLDAPRHFFLHTERSMSILAAKAGFKVSKIIYDSTGIQFWLSESYKRNFSFPEQVKLPYFPYSKEELNEFEKRAKILNEQGQGDQASFFLQKI